MKTQIGIWIDTKKAIIVTLTEANQNLCVVESGIESRERFDGEGKAFGRFGEQYLNDERAKDERFNHQTSTYLNSIIEYLKPANEFVIFGPAGMKVELKKLVEKDHILSSRLQSVESADKLTDNQIAAWVRDYFNN